MKFTFNTYLIFFTLLVGILLSAGCIHGHKPPPLKATTTPPQSEELSPSPPPIVIQGKSEVDEIKKEEVNLPQDSRAYYHFLRAQSFQIEDDHENALKEYQQALKYDPDSAVIQTEIATTYLKQGQLDEATNMCKEALINNSRYLPANLLLARIYLSAKDYEAAIAQF